jgi:hypothetical protein
MFQREVWFGRLPEMETVYVDLFFLVVLMAGNSVPHHCKEHELLELWAGAP